MNMFKIICLKICGKDMHARGCGSIGIQSCSELKLNFSYGCIAVSININFDFSTSKCLQI